MGKELIHSSAIRPLPAHFNGYDPQQEYYAADETPTGTPSLRDLIALLKKHSKTVLLSIAGFIAAAALYCFFATPLFTAKSTIEIRGYAPVMANLPVEALYGVDTRKIEYQKTTIAKLWRPGIADRVLSREGMLETLHSYFNRDEGGFVSSAIDGVRSLLSGNKAQKVAEERELDPNYKNPPEVISSYLGLIDINPVIDTSLVEIEASTADPELSRKLANAHAESFIEDLAQERRAAMQQNLKTLQAQADELSKKLSDAESELNKYASENQLIIPETGEGDSLTMKNLVTLSENLANATAKRMRSENLLAELKAAGASDVTTLDDESVRPLRLELERATAEYRAMGRRVTGEFPAMQELAGRIASLKQSIAGQRQSLYQGLKIQVDSDRAAEVNLAKQLEAEKAKGYEQSKRLVRYNVLRKGSDSLRQLYEAILKQVQETQVSASTGGSNIVISDYATLPRDPSSPKTKLAMVIAAIVGAIVGVLIALVREVLNNKVRTPDDIPAAANLPVLGSLPPFEASRAAEKEMEESRNGKLRYLPFAKRAAEAKSKKEGVANLPARRHQDTHEGLVAISSPHTVVAEALRTIRASLLLSSVDDPSKVIMVSSANQGEGKTTISANLAVSLAQADYKTLLIDGDLRQAAMPTLFNEDPRGPGLTECLSGQAGPGSLLKTTPVQNLMLLGAGTQPPNPAELLGSRRLGDLIAELSKLFDFIIIDSAPILPVADSLMLSQHVDSVILVARSDTSVKSSVLEASQRLRRVKARLAGVIMNGYWDRSFAAESDSNYYVYPKAANG